MMEQRLRNNTTMNGDRLKTKYEVRECNIRPCMSMVCGDIQNVVAVCTRMVRMIMICSTNQF